MTETDCGESNANAKPLTEKRALSMETLQTPRISISLPGRNESSSKLAGPNASKNVPLSLRTRIVPSVEERTAASAARIDTYPESWRPSRADFAEISSGLRAEREAAVTLTMASSNTGEYS